MPDKSTLTTRSESRSELVYIVHIMSLVCPHLVGVFCRQTEDIIKFGLDRLFQPDDDSSVESHDFAAILGPTVDRRWQLSDSTSDTLEVDIIRRMLKLHDITLPTISHTVLQIPVYTVH